MDVRFVLDALVITTIVIFAVCLGLVGYSSIKKKLAHKSKINLFLAMVHLIVSHLYPDLV